MDKQRGEGERRGGGRRKGIGSSGGRSSPSEGGGAGRGAFVIVRVGARGRWWGAGRRFSIMVVVGTHGGAGRARGRWWRRHAKGVERGALVIVCVGARQRWWGAGHRLSIVVVVGPRGWHWVVVAINGAGGRLSSFVGGGGACAWRRGRRSWVFVVGR